MTIKLRPSTCAAGSIPGRIPDAPVSAGTAQSSPCRIGNNWFLFPRAFATRPWRLVRHPPRVLLCTLYIASVLAGFHVEAVLLYFLDDVFLLHFALETAQCVFQRLTLLDNDFCQF
jgi:hypothetical protein